MYHGNCNNTARINQHSIENHPVEAYYANVIPSELGVPEM
jgi:hypothetical protein